MSGEHSLFTKDFGVQEYPKVEDQSPYSKQECKYTVIFLD